MRRHAGASTTASFSTTVTGAAAVGGGEAATPVTATPAAVPPPTVAMAAATGGRGDEDGRRRPHEATAEHVAERDREALEGSGHRGAAAVAEPSGVADTAPDRRRHIDPRKSQSLRIGGGGGGGGGAIRTSGDGSGSRSGSAAPRHAPPPLAKNGTPAVAAAAGAKPLKRKTFSATAATTVPVAATAAAAARPRGHSAAATSPAVRRAAPKFSAKPVTRGASGSDSAVRQTATGRSTAPATGATAVEAQPPRLRSTTPVRATGRMVGASRPPTPQAKAVQSGPAGAPQRTLSSSGLVASRSRTDSPVTMARRQRLGSGSTLAARPGSAGGRPATVRGHSFTAPRAPRPGTAGTAPRPQRTNSGAVRGVPATAKGRSLTVPAAGHAEGIPQRSNSVLSAGPKAGNCTSPNRSFSVRSGGSPNPKQPRAAMARPSTPTHSHSTRIARGALATRPPSALSNASSHPRPAAAKASSGSVTPTPRNPRGVPSDVLSQSSFPSARFSDGHNGDGGCRRRRRSQSAATSPGARDSSFERRKGSSKAASGPRSTPPRTDRTATAPRLPRGKSVTAGSCGGGTGSSRADSRANPKSPASARMPPRFNFSKRRPVDKPLGSTLLCAASTTSSINNLSFHSVNQLAVDSADATSGAKSSARCSIPSKPLRQPAVPANVKSRVLGATSIDSARNQLERSDGASPTPCIASSLHLSDAPAGEEGALTPRVTTSLAPHDEPEARPVVAPGDPGRATSAVAGTEPPGVPPLGWMPRAATGDDGVAPAVVAVPECATQDVSLIGTDGTDGSVGAPPGSPLLATLPYSPPSVEEQGAVVDSTVAHDMSGTIGSTLTNEEGLQRLATVNSPLTELSDVASPISHNGLGPRGAESAGPTFSGQLQLTPPTITVTRSPADGVFTPRDGAVTDRTNDRERTPVAPTNLNDSMQFMRPSRQLRQQLQLQQQQQQQKEQLTTTPLGQVRGGRTENTFGTEELQPPAPHATSLSAHAARSAAAEDVGARPVRRTLAITSSPHDRCPQRRANPGDASRQNHVTPPSPLGQTMTPQPVPSATIVSSSIHQHQQLLRNMANMTHSRKQSTGFVRWLARDTSVSVSQHKNHRYRGVTDSPQCNSCSSGSVNIEDGVDDLDELDEPQGVP